MLLLNYMKPIVLKLRKHAWIRLDGIVEFNVFKWLMLSHCQWTLITTNFNPFDITVGDWHVVPITEGNTVLFGKEMNSRRQVNVLNLNLFLTVSFLFGSVSCMF